MKKIKDNTELISVIIPVYNVSNYIRRCVDSVLNQTYMNIEIILVDDGSTDDSGMICDEYARKEVSVKVIHQKNQGLGPARNAGLDIMQGKYVGFVDSDDWIAPNMYECLYNAIKNNNCNIATCGRRVVSDEGILSEVYCSSKGKKLNRENAVKHYLIQKDMNMSACDKLFESNLFTDIRFPGDFYTSEDTIPIYQVINKSKAVFLTGKPFYNYYCRLDSLSRSAFSLKAMGAYMYANEILKAVNKELPRLREAAEYFLYDAIITTYRKIRKANFNGNEKKEVFQKMKKNFGKIMKNSYLYKRQKIYVILAFLRMDKLFDKLYVVIKQKHLTRKMETK